MSIDDYVNDDEYWPGYWPCDDEDICLTCGGDGVIALRDGFWEYLGYSYEACPDCEDGMIVYCQKGPRF